MLNKCRICKTRLDNKRAKICKNSKCKSKWKMVRNSRLESKLKNCKNCNKSFSTKDSRNNFCSSKCRINTRHLNMIIKYGKKSVTSPWKSRRDKITKTNERKYGGSAKRHQWLVERGHTSIEDLLRKIYSFCKVHNVAPNSKFCLNHFNMSTYMNRLLEEYGFGDILHNTYRSSHQEKELQAFIDGIGIKDYKTNRRLDFLDGKELDIYIPSENLAIEFHGLVHHSERPVFYKYNEDKLRSIRNNHAFKYIKCKEKNINLIQIFEDEWRDNRPIIESMIKSKLGKTDTRIHGRNCEIRLLERRDRQDFFNNNHIAGSTRSVIAFGLFHEDELVSALSLRNTWNKKYGENVIEIARFASLLNVTVVGGFSKLLKRASQWALDNKYDKILTYSDCRFGSGNVYLKNGFTHVGTTAPNYFYEKNGVRENRFKHRKNNDPKFIMEFGSTEREQNNNQGWYAIYDAGNEVYVKNIDLSNLKFYHSVSSPQITE